MEINNLLQAPVHLSLGNEILPIIEQKAGAAPEPVLKLQRKENSLLRSSKLWTCHWLILNGSRKCSTLILKGQKVQ